jgi:hypothetical protein
MALLFSGNIGPSGWGSSTTNTAVVNTGGTDPGFTGADVGSMYYLNGVPATLTATHLKTNLQNVLNTWHHAVFVLTRQITDSRFAINLLNYQNGCAGSNIIIGRVSIYSSALSQADAAQNYNAGF